MQDSVNNLEFDSILKTLQSKNIYWELKNQLFQKLLNSDIPVAEWHQEINNLAVANRIDTKLKSIIFDLTKTIIKHDPIKSDNIPTINDARTTWSEFLVKNLITVSNKLLHQMSDMSAQKKVDKEKEQDRKERLFIYDAKALRNACASICFLKSKPKEGDLGCLNTPLSNKFRFENIEAFDMKNMYPELNPKEKNLVGYEEDDPDVVTEREEMAEILLSKGGSLDIENYCKKGVPSGIRIQVYRKYFGIDQQIKSKKDKHYHQIQESLKNHKYIIDEIIADDVREVLNDDRYFVFDEILSKTIWTFFRDKIVYEKLAILPILPFNTLEDTNKVIPYCGVIPCKDFSRYATPFMYTSEKPEEAYMLFREFYCRYFCFLNSLSSHPNSILKLCHIFEEIIYKANHKLCTYFISKNPLVIAFPWMMYCFIGYLDTEQLFCLFDRIIGYNSLEIVAILAAAIITSKTDQIMKCKNIQQIEDLFSNLYEYNVIIGIREFLFEN